jgi:hypothetical protein
LAGFDSVVTADCRAFEERGVQHHVIVSFGEERQFDFRLSTSGKDGQATDDARQWFEREFVALECDLPTPIGKVLLADRILSVAKYAGERRFKEDRGWAEQFAKNAATLLGRDLVRVDVANYTLGY